MGASTTERTETIKAWLADSAGVLTLTAGAQTAQIARAAELMIEAIRGGRKIIWFGNGGSATQSQHMAAEFVGRFLKERPSWPSMSLTENVGSLTAIGNDYAYEEVFARQLQGLAQAGDVAVGISTSGSSANVLKALEVAKPLRVKTIGLTSSKGPGAMRQRCDVCIEIPSSVTARIQEAHLAVGHILCGLIEETLLAEGWTPRR